MVFTSKLCKLSIWIQVSRCSKGPNRSPTNPSTPSKYVTCKKIIFKFLRYAKCLVTNLWMGLEVGERGRGPLHPVKVWTGLDQDWKAVKHDQGPIHLVKVWMGLDQDWKALKHERGPIHPLKHERGSLVCGSGSSLSAQYCGLVWSGVFMYGSLALKHASTQNDDVYVCSCMCKYASTFKKILMMMAHVGTRT